MPLFRRPQRSEYLDHKLVSSLASAKIPGIKQLKLLPALLKPRELWILRVAIAIILLVLSAFTTRIINGHIQAVPRQGGTYREALVGSPYLINPVLAVSDVDKDLSRLIYPALLRYNDQGELEGDLAAKFSIAEEGRAIEFVIGDNIFWHDGQPLTVRDAEFTIAAIQNPLWRSPLWQSFQDITVEVPDEHTIIARSSATLAGFAHLFTVGILPKHIWEQVDTQQARLAVWNTKPVGAGPFQFKSLSKTQDGTVESYRLERYESYHKGTPFLREIVLKFFSDFESAVAALKSQHVDGVSFIPERLISRLSGTNINSDPADFPNFTVLFFQDRRAGVLKDKTVRRALSMAVSRDDIVKIVPGARATGAPFLPDQIGYAQTMPYPERDLDGARALLEESGWNRTEEGWKKDGQILRVTLTVPDEAVMVESAGAIKHFWEELGVLVALKSVSRSTLESEILRPRVYEVLLLSIISGADPDPYAFWHSSQMDDPGLNLSSVKSRAVDIALEQGRSTAGPKERLIAYLKFQNALYEDVPAIVLYRTPYIYAQSKRLRRLDIGKMITPADRFNAIETWSLRSWPAWK